MATKKKLPADTNKRAKAIVDIATSDKETEKEKDELQSAAAILGRKGGLKGGVARAEKLSEDRRSEIAKKAAAARWHNSKD